MDQVTKNTSSTVGISDLEHKAFMAGRARIGTIWAFNDYPAYARWSREHSGWEVLPTVAPERKPLRLIDALRLWWSSRR